MRAECVVGLHSHVVPGQQGPKNLLDVGRVVELVLPVDLDVLRLAEVGDDEPGLSEGPHEHLEDGRVQVVREFAHVGPDFFGGFAVCEDLTSVSVTGGLDWGLERLTSGASPRIRLALGLLYGMPGMGLGRRARWMRKRDAATPLGMSRRLVF